MARPPRGETSLPDRIAPMLARSVSAPFDSADHLFEVKWDGTRCLALVERGRFRMLNRRCMELSPRYPDLAGLAGLPHGTVVDGEIVVLDGGRPSFHKLQQRDHLGDPERIRMAGRRLPATYVAFDLLYDHGDSVMPLPLTARRSRLQELLAGLADPRIVFSDGIREHGRDYFAAVEKQGLEGVMAKRLDSPYLPGIRSDCWIKVKVARTGCFDVLGLTCRPGSEVMSALVVGEHDGSRWVYRGNVGTGFTEADRAEIGRQLLPCPPLPAPPADGPRDAIWRATKVRCAVRYFEYTEQGRLRGPVFQGFVDERYDGS